MANKLYEESSISAIAGKIREKAGVASTYKVADMAAAINTVYNKGYADGIEAGGGGGGGSGDLSYEDLFRAGLVAAGYTVTEYTPVPGYTGANNKYFEVNNPLGEIPDKMIVLCTDINYSTDYNTYYVAGIAMDIKNGGLDAGGTNSTFRIPKRSASGAGQYLNAFSETLPIDIALNLTATSYYVCNGATAEKILIRNLASGSNNERAKVCKWLMGVKA